MNWKTFAIIVAFMFRGTCLAYEVNVHEKISTTAFGQAFAQRDFLTPMGLTQNTQFIGNSAEGWVAYGSNVEDAWTRPGRHFFDPVSGNGLNGSIPGIPYAFESALDWAFDAANNTDWSVPEARRHLTLALTNSDPLVREAEWAMTFQAIGQFTHLLQDMAQPQHVRNDLHVSLSESQVFIPQPILDVIFPGFSRYERYTRTAALNYDGYPTVTLPDSRSYWRDVSGAQRGLAEFTNRNFISEDTIFLNYSSPALADIFLTDVQTTVVTLNGVSSNVTVGYGGSNYTDPYTLMAESNPYLVARSMFDFIHRQLRGQPVFTLTDVNHQAYADRLIPRAVGYSAGLINYFFRGNIDVIPYPNIPGMFAIKNIGTENMSGTFSLYYDDANGVRNLVFTTPSFLNIPANGQSDPISFTPPPAAKNPDKYMLVFNGDMGQEVQTAVTAKVVTLGTLTTCPSIGGTLNFTNGGNRTVASVTKTSGSPYDPAQGSNEMYSVEGTAPFKIAKRVIGGTVSQDPANWLYLSGAVPPQIKIDATNKTGTITTSGNLGEDKTAYTLSGNTLTFNAQPDFETPTDLDNDNVYKTCITAVDQQGETGFENIAAQVKYFYNVDVTATPQYATQYTINTTKTAYVASINVPDRPSYTHINLIEPINEARTYPTTYTWPQIENQIATTKAEIDAYLDAKKPEWEQFAIGLSPGGEQSVEEVPWQYTNDGYHEWIYEAFTPDQTTRTFIDFMGTVTLGFVTLTIYPNPTYNFLPLTDAGQGQPYSSSISNGIKTDRYTLITTQKIWPLEQTP